jgi:hypothetical protein
MNAAAIRRTAGDLAIMLGAFAVVGALAAAFGAANFGTALAFGQIGFAAALVWVLLRRSSAGVPPPGARPRTPPRARSAGKCSDA